MRKWHPLLLLPLALLAMPARAQPDSAPATLSVGYTISFWNIDFGHTNYDVSLTPAGYSAKAHFETGGVIGVFWKSVIDANVSGTVGPHSIAPSTYDSYSRNRNRPLQRVKLDFDGDDPTTFADPPYNLTDFPVTEEQKKGAVDPMSAITSILVAGADAPCGNDVKVFDGRRRYDISFTYLRDEPVKLKNGLFDGTAHLCQIHYRQIAGYNQKLVREGRPFPDTFADFAPMPDPGAPGGHYNVPVRVWAQMSLGTMSVTLNALKLDSAAAAAKS